jgi:predicted metal-binding membrane protein
MSTQDMTILEVILKRDRVFALMGLIGISTLAWIYLIILAVEMQGASMGSVVMPIIKHWNAVDFWVMFVMWSVMMVAMMLPSATPMILLHAHVGRRQQERGQPFPPTAAFMCGYLIVWIIFSVIATVMQWVLEQWALLSPMMVSTSPYLGGGLLFVAGIYQWTPLKQACLENCRSPIEFLSRAWRPGTGGALVMGFHHGIYCVGCCWLLMAMLFVGGVMNLLWVGAIAGFVLLEKILPYGVIAGRFSSILFILTGIIVMINP